MIRWQRGIHRGLRRWRILRGDLAEAERSAEQALQIGRRPGSPTRLMIYGGQIGLDPVMQGRGDEVVRCSSRAWRQTR